MGKQLLVIYDLDAGYGEGLFAYLKGKKGFPFEVKLITDLSNLSDEEEVSLLLVDYALEGMDFGAKVKQVVYLSEDREDRIHINRYQAMEKVIEKIQEHCEVSVETLEHVNSTSKIGMACMIGVYSPIGGCGKTELAKKITSYMARNGETAYYLDFELVPNKEGAKKVNFFFDLHEKLMFKEEKWKQYFSCMDGVNYLNASLYQSELWELREEDMSYLAKGIQKRGERASYILDIGFLNHAIITLLHSCDYWVLPYREGELSKCKINNLEQLLKFQGEEELLDKMLRFNVEQRYDEVLKKLVF